MALVHSPRPAAGASRYRVARYRVGEGIPHPYVEWLKKFTRYAAVIYDKPATTQVLLLEYYPAKPRGLRKFPVPKHLASWIGSGCSSRDSPELVTHTCVASLVLPSGGLVLVSDSMVSKSRVRPCAEEDEPSPPQREPAGFVVQKVIRLDKPRLIYFGFAGRETYVNLFWKELEVMIPGELDDKDVFTGLKESCKAAMQRIRRMTVLERDGEELQLKVLLTARTKTGGCSAFVIDSKGRLISDAGKGIAIGSGGETWIKYVSARLLEEPIRFTSDRSLVLLSARGVPHAAVRHPNTVGGDYVYALVVPGSLSDDDNVEIFDEFYQEVPDKFLQLFSHENYPS